MSGIIAQNILDGSGLVKAPEGGGAWNFIAKQTASSSATIDFTSGIDSTYKEYCFTFKDIHPATDAVHLQINFSVDSGSNYNVTKTTTYFRAYHQENGGGGVLAYDTGFDLAQSTAFQDLTGDSVSTDSDYGVSGFIHLFNPSSTTFVKHFIANINNTEANDYQTQWFIAGYGNTTSAIDAVQFKMSSGNIDAGTIKMYGIN